MFTNCLKDYLDKTTDLEQLCKLTLDETNLAVVLERLNSGKKAILESSVYALQEGEAMLEKLENLWMMTAIDSRPDFLRPSISRAIGKVWILSQCDQIAKLFLSIWPTTTMKTCLMAGKHFFFCSINILPHTTYHIKPHKFARDF